MREAIIILSVVFGLVAMFTLTGVAITSEHNWMPWYKKYLLRWGFWSSAFATAFFLYWADTLIP